MSARRGWGILKRAMNLTHFSLSTENRRNGVRKHYSYVRCSVSHRIFECAPLRQMSSDKTSWVAHNARTSDKKLANPLNSRQLVESFGLAMNSICGMWSSSQNKFTCSFNVNCGYHKNLQTKPMWISRGNFALVWLLASLQVRRFYDSHDDLFTCEKRLLHILSEAANGNPWTSFMAIHRPGSSTSPNLLFTSFSLSHIDKSTCVIRWAMPLQMLLCNKSSRSDSRLASMAIN